MRLNKFYSVLNIKVQRQEKAILYHFIFPPVNLWKEDEKRTPSALCESFQDQG